MKIIRYLAWLLVGALGAPALADLPTAFTNRDGIINTRHNMMQNTIPYGFYMNNYRNTYGQVCVYCHTPHSAAASAGAPLWNRLLPAATSFTTYDTLNTSSLEQTVYNPGAASLPCLSCHDGVWAMDAILNMPGSNQYSAAADPTTFVPSTGQMKSSGHLKLTEFSCLACHAGEGIQDFTSGKIGKDLRDDHPIGVTYPTVTGGDTGWNTPTGTKVVSGSLTTKYFDSNGNGRFDKADIRLYGTTNEAGRYTVECATCHDPHGVADGGGNFFPTFMRKTNDGSGLCLTCHAK